MEDEMDKIITVKNGYGYWDMKSYPWGGSFNRFDKDYELKIVKVYSTYKDGSPKQVESLHPVTGNKIGVQL